MTNQKEVDNTKHIGFVEWLQHTYTFKISANSKREIRLLPRWLLLVLGSLANATRSLGESSIGGVLIEVIVAFIFCSILWYGFSRWTGATARKPQL